MYAKRLALALILLAVSSPVMAEMLIWDAVTTYTDGTPVGTSRVMYRVFWSESMSMIPLTEIGTASRGTKRKFHVAHESMPRGATIYFTARAIVEGAESANAAPLTWTVPKRNPSAPGNFRRYQKEETK